MDKIKCNKCGRLIKAENGIIREDYLHINKEWGYFSENDGLAEEFNLCEPCVRSIVKEFVIAPVMYDIEI